MDIFMSLVQDTFTRWPSLLRKARMNRWEHRLFPMNLGDSQQIWKKMRSRALRRDRHRCRGCDSKGGDDLLTVYPIAQGKLHLDGLLTLCVSCRAIARDLQLKGDDLPEFLRQLWRYLHSPAEMEADGVKILNIGCAK